MCQKPTRAPQQTTVYSIASSARASSAGGTSKRSAFAAITPVETARGGGERVEWCAMLTDLRARVGGECPSVHGAISISCRSCLNELSQGFPSIRIGF